MNWSIPDIFECDGCGRKDAGALDSGGDCILPGGWRYAGDNDPWYACSAECQEAVRSKFTVKHGKGES